MIGQNMYDWEFHLVILSRGLSRKLKGNSELDR